MNGASTTIFWVYLVTGLVTLLFTGIVVAVVVATQRRQVEQSRRFSQGLVDAQEEERARIARDLHDDVIQRVALIGGELSALGRMIPDRSDAVTQRIDGLREELNDLAEEVRGMARRAHPGILGHLGLVRALETLANDMSVSDSVEVEVAFDPEARFDRLAPAAALALFRVAQEGLRNVVRHSGMKSARVVLVQREGGVAITIEDRGRGMRRDAREQSGLGLIGLTERLRAVQGELSIDSVEGTGTKVTAWVPEKGET